MAKVETYGGVTKDTPILCRLGDNVFYTTIEELPKHWEYVNDVRGTKEYVMPQIGLEVWSDKGFTSVRNIIRHKTNKKIYRVTTGAGMVCVTEDHSLLDSQGNKISPSNIPFGQPLLHDHLPEHPDRENIKCLTDNYMCRMPEYDIDIGLYSNMEFDNQIDAANNYWIRDSLGEHICLEYYNGKYSVYQSFSASYDAKRIEHIGTTNDYVYDIETDNHHFAAGIGQLIVHNTDSCMICFPGKSLE